MAHSGASGPGLRFRRDAQVVVAQATPQGVAPKPRAPSSGPGPSRTGQTGQRLVLTELLGGQERDLLPGPSVTPLGSASSTSSSDVDYVGAGAGLDGSGRPRGGPPPLLNLRELFLPPGYPDTVTPDYLAYQLWSVPTHITGHLSHALVTSSLLSAVGVSAGPTATVALSASIKWIVKDGVGALGRLIVGSRFSAEFDEDPRRWRMVAELLSTCGLGLEVATVLYPQYFLALACSGKFAQALGKGMGKPVFRVIQTHFARAQNVGAVAAKEEVWEVAAQMAGLAASVAVLRALEASGAADGVVGTWAAIQAVHVALRYRALATLQFPSLSLKRAAILAAAHVRAPPATGGAGGGAAAAVQLLPGVAEVNAEEGSLASVLSADPPEGPRLRLGCGVAEAFGGAVPGEGLLRAYAQAYGGEAYWLVWAPEEGVARVVLKEGAGPRDVLRAVWQAAWLEARCGGRGGLGVAESGAGAVASSSPHHSGGVNGSGAPADNGRGALEGSRAVEAALGQQEGLPGVVRESLEALAAGFDGFVSACERAGWEVGVVHIKTGRARLREAAAA
ncbi:hypothetical protein HYH02_006823 [Chlamydomonas schloesseri]|uniref:Uncharacterized protein n=1 Tax=Chlamydomonas schloesseri TaxID=2026947 RepID=A0A836B5S6_9CHLO|nr:hypothetical protein HYH02_006823 [Chlamydomonas schloesseri]|eukprot:KAG2448238.1 hypothetical protein HYH02_006823 [Chlamydomonas schloesseri]